MREVGPEQWGEVRRLFGAALELAPEARTGFIDRIEDEAVRQEVRSLLKHLEAGETMGEGPYQGADEQRIGTRVGPYRIESILGHGGMGAVYRAARDDGEFQQVVAIKLVRAAAESPETMQRFRQERQILARLSHPNIARLLDGGSTDQGVPYLVMEFVAGEPITVWCRHRELGFDERLRLWIDVSSAVDYANKRAVVHRDLKPGNILVTDEGVPKLLDFGIAKLLEPGMEAQSTATRVAGPAMTPAYASPEQVRGHAVTAASDVYSLAAVLYELLAGTPVHRFDSQSLPAIDRIVCETEIPPPSAAVDDKLPDAGRIRRRLAGDLDNILLMALRKDPERRYASADQFADDLRRHLDGRPVLARPDTIGYRAARFLRRNRAAAAAVVGAALLAAGIGMVYRPSRSLGRLRTLQLTHTGTVDPYRVVLTDGSRIFFGEQPNSLGPLAEVSVDGGSPSRVQTPPGLPSLEAISPDRSELLVIVASHNEAQAPLWVVPIGAGHPHRVGTVLANAATWSPDGRSIVYATGRALYRMNSDGTGARKLADTPGEPAFLRWSPRQPPVIRFTLPGSRDSIWECAPDGSGMRAYAPSKPWAETAHGALGAGWTPDGKYYLFESRDEHGTGLWAVPEDRGLFHPFAQRPFQINAMPTEAGMLAPSADGKRLFFPIGIESRDLVSFDAKRGQFLPFLGGLSARSVIYSPDGQRLVVS